MTQAGLRILLLGLGNDLLGDDAVGQIAAKRLEPNISEEIDVAVSGEAGLALVERMEGYDRVLILDAIMTGTHPPGTILEFTPDDLGQVVAPSPHYAGIPEVIDLANRIGIVFPDQIHLLAMEISPVAEIREGLSPVIERCLPTYQVLGRRILRSWISASDADRSELKEVGLASV